MKLGGGLCGGGNGGCILVWVFVFLLFFLMCLLVFKEILYDCLLGV